MDRAPKRDVDMDLEWLLEGEVSSDPAGEAGPRQLAASWLRAARLTDDAKERDALRRRAAELLSPRRAGRRAEAEGRRKR